VWSLVLPLSVATAAVAVAAFGGCVVVPLDPRSGQPELVAAPACAPAQPASVTFRMLTQT
jgi:hypothetical protein